MLFDIDTIEIKYHRAKINDVINWTLTAAEIIDMNNLRDVVLDYATWTLTINAFEYGLKHSLPIFPRVYLEWILGMM